MNLTIRSCTPADAPALALAGKATFLETYSTVLPAADILAHCERQHGEPVYAAFLADPACKLWIAETETGVGVGYAVLCPPDLPAPFGLPDLELKRIYLLSRFQGSGVGAGLMAAAVDAARTAGAPRLLLGVYEGNARAIAFYSRQGFARVGTRKFPVGANIYDDLVLARPL